MQGNGMPQGGMFKCTVFKVEINSVGKAVAPTISYSMYVDDVQISCKSCDMSICERELQLGVRKHLS